MADEIKIVAHKSGLYITNASEFDRRLTERVNHLLIQAGLYAQAELQRATPVGATGNMRRAWTMEVKYEETSMGRLARIEVHNPTLYLEPTESGRKAAPISKTGMKSLELWVSRKIGAAMGQAKSIAYAIARKKAMYPTPGQHFIEKTLESVIPRIIESFATEFPNELKIIAESSSDQQNMQ